MRQRRALAAVALTVVAMTMSASAWADTGTYPPTGPGSGNYPPSGPAVSPSVSPTTQVKGEQVQQSPLPFTGAEIFAMSVGGTALVAGGVGFVVIGRRRRRAASE